MTHRSHDGDPDYDLDLDLCDTNLLTDIPNKNLQWLNDLDGYHGEGQGNNSTQCSEGLVYECSGPVTVEVTLSDNENDTNHASLGFVPDIKECQIDHDDPKASSDLEMSPSDQSLPFPDLSSVNSSDGEVNTQNETIDVIVGDSVDNIEDDVTYTDYIDNDTDGQYASDDEDLADGYNEMNDDMIVKRRSSNDSRDIKVDGDKVLHDDGMVEGDLDLPDYDEMDKIEFPMTDTDQISPGQNYSSKLKRDISPVPKYSPYSRAHVVPSGASCVGKGKQNVKGTSQFKSSTSKSTCKRPYTSSPQPSDQNAHAIIKKNFPVAVTKTTRTNNATRHVTHLSDHMFQTIHKTDSDDNAQDDLEDRYKNIVKQHQKQNQKIKFKSSAEAVAAAVAAAETPRYVDSSDDTDDSLPDIDDCDVIDEVTEMSDNDVKDITNDSGNYSSSEIKNLVSEYERQRYRREYEKGNGRRLQLLKRQRITGARHVTDCPHTSEGKMTLKEKYCDKNTGLQIGKLPQSSSPGTNTERMKRAMTQKMYSVRKQQEDLLKMFNQRKHARDLVERREQPTGAKLKSPKSQKMIMDIRSKRRAEQHASRPEYQQYRRRVLAQSNDDKSLKYKNLPNQDHSQVRFAPPVKISSTTSGSTVSARTTTTTTISTREPKKLPVPAYPIKKEVTDSVKKDKDVPASTDIPKVDLTKCRMLCEACEDTQSHNSLVQCNDSHVVCTKCVEKAAKCVLVGEVKGHVVCPVDTCSSAIPQSELRKALPSLVLDLLEEKWKKETLDALEAMNDGVTCPGCGYTAVLDVHIKQFKCNNCNKRFCRHCEMEWHARQHDLCIRTVTRTSPDTGSAIQIPAHWLDTADKEGNASVDLGNTSEEYKEISALFLSSMKKNCGSITITNVYRIQNQRLWEKYSLVRSHFTNDLGELHINERRLFHGTTTKVIDAICKEGFDWRLSGRHGTMYGQGSYFALDAAYSHTYSSRGGGGSAPASHTTGFAFGPGITQPTQGQSNSSSGFMFGQPTQGQTGNVTGSWGPGISQPQANNPSQQSTTSSSGFIWAPGVSQQPSSPFWNTGHQPRPFGSAPRTSGFTLPIPNTNTNHGFNFGSAQNTSSNIAPQRTQSHLFVKQIPARIQQQIPLSANTSTTHGLKENFMFVGRVLVGRTCRGRPEMKRPDKDESDPAGRMCHSAVDSVNHPRIFVVFESAQCFPEYLIKYTS